MKIKETPEDFVVKERSRLQFDDSGDWLYLKLSKKGITTIDAMRLIAERLHINEQRITCAGMKDRQACTEQAISIQDKDKSVEKRIGQLALPGISLEILGRGAERISLGDLEGNSFAIVCRELSEKEIAAAKAVDGKRIAVENYFDDQRFQSVNVQVGLHLLRKEYAKACALLRMLEENALNEINRRPKRELLFAISAVQSYLFNEILAAKVLAEDPKAKQVAYAEGTMAFSERRVPCAKLPLIGFATEFLAEDDQVFAPVLERLGITPRDFVLRQLNGMAQEGSERDTVVETTVAVAVKENTATLSFDLPKASYATVVVRKVFA